jgi:hypothetical protein
MWSQVYLRSGGVELDNIPQYGRFHQQYGWNHLSMLEQFGEAGISGFGGSWSTGNVQTNRPDTGGINANQAYTVLHKMHLSMFSSGKLLPTRYMPLELELQLGATVSDYLVAARDGTNFSTNFTLQNIQLVYDVYEADAAVSESFYRSLLSNQVLSIPTMTVYQVVQSIPPGSTTFSFAAVRAFSRLSHVWLTFRGTGPRSTEFICPTTMPADQVGSLPILSDVSPSARLSIGPHYWPDPQSLTTIPEIFYQFQQALPGVANINRDNFLKGNFTIVFNLQKMPGDPTSALSTRSGDLVSVFLQNLSPNVATECWMTFFAFSVTAVRESGVTLLT